MGELSSQQPEDTQKKESPLVSIIVLNWNGIDFIDGCLSSLLNCKYAQKEIIMVDNGSTDGSVEYVSQRFPDVIIIRNEKNKGVGSGFNDGIAVSRGKYITNLANDTEVDPSFIDELVKIFENDDSIGACQHKLLLMRDRKTLDAVGSFLTKSGFLLHQAIFQKDMGFDKVSELFTAKGSAISFRKSVLDKVGPYDPNIFLFFEDTDLCWRIWLYGYRIVFIPKSIVYHFFGGSLPKIPSCNSEFHSFKNRLRTLLIYLEKKNILRILPLYVGVCAGMFFFYVWKRRIFNDISILKAFIMNITEFPKTYQKRVFIHTYIKRVSDKVLLPRIMLNMDIQKMMPSLYESYLKSNR